jgi:hypothetical protein
MINTKTHIKYTYVLASLAFEIVSYMFSRKCFEFLIKYWHRIKQTTKEHNRHVNISQESEYILTFFCVTQICFTLLTSCRGPKCTHIRSSPGTVSYASIELREVLISQKQMTSISINLRWKSRRKEKAKILWKRHTSGQKIPKCRGAIRRAET